MSQAADRHLTAMVMAIKLDLHRNHPLAPKVRLGPDALECLSEGNWEGVAVSYLVDFANGRDVTIGPEALRHFLAWADLPEVSQDLVMRELIADFNTRAEREAALIDAQSRPLNRAERRRAKRGA